MLNKFLAYKKKKNIYTLKTLFTNNVYIIRHISYMYIGKYKALNYTNWVGVVPEADDDAYDNGDDNR